MNQLQCEPEKGYIYKNRIRDAEILLCPCDPVHPWKDHDNFKDPWGDDLKGELDKIKNTAVTCRGNDTNDTPTCFIQIDETKYRIVQKKLTQNKIYVFFSQSGGIQNFDKFQ